MPEQSRETSEEPKVKGLAVLNLVAAFRDAVENPSQKVPEELRPYLEERILVSSWYPEKHHLRLMEILAEELKIPGKDVWVFLGRKNAEIDLDGIYSAMVMRGNPRATLERFPRIWRLYRDHGSPEVVAATEDEGVIEIGDYPFAGSTMARLVKGYLEEALRQAGSGDVTVEIESEGSEDQPMRWRARWSAG